MSVNKNPHQAQIDDLVAAVRRDFAYICTLPIDDTSSTVIFRAAYDALRQSADALLLSEGRKSQSHDESMERLIQITLPDVSLEHMDRYRRLRNRVQYEGNFIAAPVTERFITLCRSAIPQILQLVQ